MTSIRPITPCLWFDSRAEEAAQFYVEVFPHSRITNVMRYTDVGTEIHGQPEGKVMVVEFELDDPDPARVKRVMAVMLQQKKMDIAELEKAYRG